MLAVASPGPPVVETELRVNPELHPLPFFYDLYTFRDRDGSTAIVAAFAVQAGELHPEEGMRGPRYRFDVTLVLADTALRSVRRADDSVFVDLPRPLAGDHLLSTHVRVHAPPSRSTVHRVIMTDATTPGIGQLYSGSFPIPDYSGTELMLSDIVLGLPEAEPGWRRGEVALALLPTRLFPMSAFDVFYEVYNLPSGNRYATEIFVEPIDETGALQVGNRTPVRLRFAGESGAGPDDSLQELRHVETSLARGYYRIAVTITDEETGATATRSRTFQVRGWTPGVTLVAALPRKGGPRAPGR